MQFALVLELEFAGDGGKRGVAVAHPRDDGALAAHDTAPLRVGHYVLEQADGEALADTRSFVDPSIGAGFESDALDQFTHELRGPDLEFAPIDPGFLGGDGHSQFDRAG